MPSIFSAGSASVQIVPDFRNAQKRIGEFFASQNDVKVKVDPDVDKTALARAKLTIHQGASTDVKVGIDQNYLQGAITKVFDQFTGFSTVAKVFEGLFGPKSILMVNGVGALTAVAGAAGQAGGAIGLLPAGISAAAAPIATLAVGLSGVGEAMKNAFDPKKAADFQAEMAKLAPAAQSFVREIVALKPAWDGLKLDVQQQLFAGLGNSLSLLATNVLPVLRTGMSTLAGTLGQIGSDIATVLSTSANTAAFGQVWASINSTFTILRGAVAPITQMFVDITTVGSQFLPGIAQAFTNAATAASNWVANARASGELQRIFQTALDTIKEIWGVVTGLGSVLNAVFSAAVGPGHILLQLLGDMLHSLGAFADTGPGFAALQIFFQQIAGVVQTLRPGIEAIVQALVVGFLPAISGLMTTLAPVVNTLLVQFADMIRQIAPLIYPALAQALGGWFSAMSPLIPVLTQIMKELLPPITQIIRELTPIISVLAQVLGQALVQAGQLLIPVLNAIASELLPMFLAGLKFLQPILPWLVTILGVAAAAWWVLNVAMTANPIGLVVIAITGLILVIGLIVTHIQGFVDFWVHSWGVVSSFFTNAWGVVSTFFTDRWNAAVAYIMGGINGFVAFWQNAWNVVSGFFTNAWSAVAGFFIDRWTQAATYIMGGINGFVAFWQNAWTVVKDFFVTKWTELKDWFVWLWGVIEQWFVQRIGVFVQNWTNFGNNVKDFFVTKWTEIKDWFAWLWGVVEQWFQQRLAAFVGFWTQWGTNVSNYFVGLWNGIYGFFQNIWGQISGWFQGVLNDFGGMWGRAWDAVSAKVYAVFTTMRDWFGGIWRDILNAFRTPINWIIDHILNQGLFAAWNWIADHIGQGGWKVTVPLIPPFDQGGFTGRVDPRKVAGVVHGNEFVLTSDQVDAAGGPGPLYSFAAALESSGRGFQVGGVVPGAMTWGNLWQIAQKMFPGVILTSAYRAGAADYHGRGDAVDLGWAGNDYNQLLRIAAGLVAAFPYSTELIHDPNASIKNGQPVPPGFWGADTWLQHINHVHWAMTPEAMAAGGGPGSGSIVSAIGSEVLARFKDVAGVFNSLKDSITGPLAELWKNFSGPVGGFLDGFAGMPTAILNELWDAAKGKVTQVLNDATAALATAAGVGGSVVPQTTAGSAGLKQQAFQIASTFGWNAVQQQQNLDFIATKESGWNPTAQNPVSSASGIWQMIDSTWNAYKNAGPWPKARNAPPGEQDVAAYRYIRQRYGDPIAAGNYWRAHNNYDRGGYLPPGWSSVYNGTRRPEPVLTAREHDALTRWQRHNQRGDDERGGMMRDVHIHAYQDRAHEIMDELWYRMRVARRGGVYSTATVFMGG